MKSHRGVVCGVLGLLIAAVSSAAPAAEYKVEALKEAPPEALSAAVRGELAETGYRISTTDGKPYLDLWLRKAVPTSKAPGGPEGAVQFPYLAPGEMLGAVRLAGEFHDFRDQTLTKGVYTLRYGVQPVDGNHLGVSEFRDFSLLLPGEKDTDIAPVKGEALTDRSAMVSGTEHPAILMILTAKADAKPEASVRHEQPKELWIVTLPLGLKVSGKDEAVVRPIDLVFEGIAEM